MRLTCPNGVMICVFGTNDLRVANRPAMKARIEARLMTGTNDHWIEKLNAAGGPRRVKTLEPKRLPTRR